MKHLSQIASVFAYTPFMAGFDDAPPTSVRRKTLAPPKASNAFVRPIRQDVMKNPRMMPMTRVIVCLLFGWAGKDQAIDTTFSILARHFGRSTRQMMRYLQDAQEEGYLTYTRRKDRIGRWIGIRIRLNFAAIKSLPIIKIKPKSPENIAMTRESETKDKSIYKRDYTNAESDYMKKLDAVLRRNNLVSLT